MTQQQVQPIFILPEGSQRTLGKEAQRNNILAAKAVAETVRTTLGPKGMDKMIVDTLGDVTVTNDGVTILEDMNIEHPSAKMIVEVAKTQENEVGDGTTTAVVLAGELLKNAEELLDQDVHPAVISRGYRLAEVKAQEILNQMAEKITANNEEILKKIAQTAMTGKGAEYSKESLAALAVKAVKMVAEDKHIDRDNIKIEKRTGGSVQDSELIKGIVIDKERLSPGMPRVIADGKIALIDREIEIKKTEIDANIQIKTPDQLQGFLDQEEKMLQDMVNYITSAGANVLLCQKGIDDVATHYLAKNGVYAVRRVSESDMKKIAKATRANIVNNLKDLSGNDLGFAGTVEGKKVGDEEFTYIQDCKNPKAVTLLIRGGTEHVTSEIERAVTDAVGDVAAALKTGLVVGGAGSPEIELSMSMKKYANSLSGREQLAVMAFATAMEVIPRTLVENAGLDPIDSMADIKAAHSKKQKWAGIDVFTGKVMDAWKRGVIEPLNIKTQAISSAAEVSVMVLRIDDVIQSASSNDQMSQQMPPGGMGGMPPGMGGMGM
ncbi:MAG: thermosome subunit alpha [Candidatus Woesearchaeota archaeon]|jgi:thermosome|nr:thermosome subunit alpha [Candidatus Woesearchaeota archaeon]MDP7622937.1 thermosome subunit alpha [Candidatus Woesearchaeota archaeon]HJN57372.1 thermosome subunit alpha [Candidatus Woesearchaeota archaeon]|tara:strand:+ start:2988 stop:4634 length:1647 start_codon:yes stop_codon:yes gene_type:complete